VGKRKQRVLTPERLRELSNKIYNYLLENEKKLRIYGKDYIKISTNVLRKRLGIHYSQLKPALRYMQRRKMIVIIGKRKGCANTIYYIRLLQKEREKEAALA